MSAFLPSVVSALACDVEAVCALVAEAFWPLEASAWLVPEPSARAGVLAANFRIVVEHALEYGTVDLLADGTAVAVWVRRERPIPPPRDYDQRLAVACGQHVDRFRILDDLFEAHHPPQPHHHLALLAVRPEYQGTGRGTALLDHHHVQLDFLVLPSYLEAASWRSAELYARNGYRRRPSFALPNGASFHPMWRDPLPFVRVTTPGPPRE